MGTLRIEQAIVKVLQDDSGVTGYVNKRIYPADWVPENDPQPYITFFIVSSEPNHLMGSDASVVSTLMQVEVFAENTYTRAFVSEEVLGALQDYSGTVTVGADSLAIQRVFLMSSRDTVIIDPQTQQKTFHRILDLEFWY